jgi:phospholipid/cholesterol/gamma-HCH transport system substrate-binding protein
MVSPLKDKSEQVLVALDRVLSSMNDVFDSTGTKKLSKSVNDLSATINNVKNITQRFDELSANESERITQMLINLESITRNLKQNNEVITSSLKNINRITDSIAASDLTKTINNVKDVMAQMTVALQNINNGNGTLGKLAKDDSLYINLNNSSRELSLLLKDMQEYPGRYVHVSVFGGKKQAKEADKKREQDKSK